VTEPEDFDRLVARAAVWREYGEIVERRQDRAMLAAEYLAAPRVKLVDESRRIVRVVNAPVEAGSRPPRILGHYRSDGELSAAGVYVGRSCGRDLDYRLLRTAAADDLLALLRDEVEPSVVVSDRRIAAGVLQTTFER
jgi:hypothetical protein